MSQPVQNATSEMGDKEAAGLLMLFSNQSQRYSRPVMPVSTVSSVPGMIGTLQGPVPGTAQSILSGRGFSEGSTGAPVSPGTHEENSIRPANKQPTTHNMPYIESTDLNHVTSPGPAAAGLASGSGSNNKAIVAAQALAAAAATPLPLLIKNHQGEFPKTTEIDAQNQSPKKRTQSQIDAAATAAAITHHLQKLQKGSRQQQQSKRQKTQPKIEDEDDKPSRGRRPSTRSRTPSYAVDPNAGIIGCICGFGHDDGFTIQCDRCFRWQHAVCMNINNVDEAPEKYLCYLCDRTVRIDFERARSIQEARINTLRQQQVSADTSVGESIGTTAATITNLDTEKIVTPLEPANVTPTQESNRKSKRTIEDSTTKERKRTPEEERFALKRYETFYVNISHYEYSSSKIMELMKRMPNLIVGKEGVLSFRSIDEFSRKMVRPSTILVKLPPDVPKSKFTGISKIGLRATRPMNQGQLISPMYGGLQLMQDYLEEKSNKYWILGCCKPNAFFIPHLPLVIDERAVGNITRFARKSCRPNCEIRTVIIGGRICVFVLTASQSIAAGDELTLPWEWDENHPINQIGGEVGNFKKLGKTARTKLINSFHAISSIACCACTDPSTCLLEKVNKLASAVVSKTGEVVISPTPNQTYDPIEDRLKSRENIISRSIVTRKKEANNEERPEPVRASTLSATVCPGWKQTDADHMGFIHVPWESMLEMAMAPPKYQLMKQYLTRSLTKPTIKVKDANVPLYTPFPIKAEELDKLTIRNASQQVKTIPLVKGTKRSGISKLSKQDTNPTRPKVVKKFSLADYKRKTKAATK
ncbi:hypothetical protein FOA43_000207 [Brettanomyces nanus]|uniref:SET domain-containing protein n=1 Tax=Eeniella nana TaxID=13502 RepID=A0A875S0C0_EENNA|nr:uncharacterized protein FOA43_000207 [Brettanomyces nanus]QPG72904.1 hypothetical protein FOA43_000207 [Brettanomyces nanus]